MSCASKFLTSVTLQHLLQHFSLLALFPTNTCYTYNNLKSVSKKFMMIKKIVKRLPIFKKFYRRLNNQFERDNFVIAELSKIKSGQLLLDAGCGSQRFREYCSHLRYKAQDFALFTKDCKKTIGSDGVGGDESYKYGALDYVGDIWDIKEKNNIFDVILCTEVFEHIPYPIETIKEFSRLLKQDGKLILTAPSNCLRHMDPYFFTRDFPIDSMKSF